MSRSPFQRFISELRRRHVPQTAAIYLVAAWAAIEFSDVVVPNLNGPQWVVTAVIVAALVGFPVMLVVAWIFEWGPEGIHRTDAEPGAEAADGGSAGRAGGGPQPGAEAARTQPWLVAVAVLAVGIGSAVAVTYVLHTTGPDESAAPAADTLRPGARAGQDREPRPEPDAAEEAGGSGVPDRGARELEALGAGMADSIRRGLTQALEVLDSLDFSDMAELGQRVAAETGRSVVIAEPAVWKYGGSGAPAPLPEGDTLRVQGAAMDTMGVVAVTVDGRTVAEADPPAPALAFTALLVGRGSAGTRTVVVGLRTADGREITREFQISQLPGGTP